MEFKEYVDRYKNYFYIAELLGILHDIGKSSLSFVKAATGDGKEADIAHTLRELFDEEFIKTVDGFVNKLIDSSSGRVDKILQPDKFMEILINHHNIGTLGELATTNYITDVVFAPGSDGIDSGFDKGNVSRGGVQRDGFFAINFAGKIQPIDINILEENRKKLQKEIVDILKTSVNDVGEKVSKIKKVIESYTKQGLAETRIPANDVKLSDHLYSVGALSKTLMVKLLWEYLNAREEKSNLIDWAFFKSIARWQVLVIEWNFDRYIQNARRISDIIGRKALLDKFKEEVEKIFEYKYPVASLLFKDDSRIAFLFAGFQPQFLKQNLGFLFEEIKQKFPQELYGETVLRFMLLKKPSSNLLKLADLFSGKRNISFETVHTDYFASHIDTGIRKHIKEKGWKHVLCDICKTNLTKSSRDETEENICEKCKNIRQKAKSISSYRNQVFDVEEIGKKLCVVYIKFPVDVWLDGSMLKTVKVRNLDIKMLDDISKELEDSFEEFKRYIKENGYTDIVQLLKVVREGERGKHIEKVFNSLENFFRIKGLFKNKFGDEYKYSYYVFLYMLEELFIQDLSEISDISFKDLMIRFYHKYPSPSRIRRILQDVQSFFDDVSGYLQKHNIKHRELLRNSDDFAVLIPHDKSLDFVEYIYKAYTENFTLVYGRFPVFIFGAYFKPKFPLYVVLEAVKNLDYVEFGSKVVEGSYIKSRVRFGGSYLEKMYLNFENSDTAEITGYTKLEGKQKYVIYPSVFDFVIFDSPDRRFETLRYKKTTVRYSYDFEKYIDRLLLDEGEFDNLKTIFEIFSTSNTAAIYKFMEVLYKNYKGWSSIAGESLEQSTWKEFVDDSVSIFFEKINESKQNILKTYSENLKIFEIFELWKYIREEKDEK